MKAFFTLSAVLCIVSGMRPNGPKSRSRRAELIAKRALSQTLTELDVSDCRRELLTPTQAEIEELNSMLPVEDIKTFSASPCGCNCAACGKCPAAIQGSGGVSSPSKPLSLNLDKNMFIDVPLKKEYKNGLLGLFHQTPAGLWNILLGFLFVLIV